MLEHKIKNVITGSVVEKTFNPSEKFPAAQIDKKEMQYLYEDSGLYYFMDNETYEQIPLNKEQLGDSLKYLKENMDVKVLSYKGKVFSIEPPIFVRIRSYIYRTRICWKYSNYIWKTCNT